MTLELKKNYGQISSNFRLPILSLILPLIEP